MGGKQHLNSASSYRPRNRSANRFHSIRIPSNFTRNERSLQVNCLILKRRAPAEDTARYGSPSRE